jgi:hypothetical protein
MILGVLLSAQGFSQINQFTGNEIHGMILTDTDTYDSEGLQNFINDYPVILEYGFSRLLVQKMEINGIRFTLNAYLMNSSEAAFGLYSVWKLNCDLQDTLTSFDCLTRYQYQAAYGPFYINLTNDAGLPATRQTSLELAGKFMEMNPQELFTLPGVFNAPSFNGYRNRIVFLNGMNAMQASPLTWQNLVVAVRFGMYAVILKGDEYDIYFARITFPAPGDMITFLSHAGLTQNGIPIPSVTTPDFIYREYSEAGSQTIYFLQAAEPWPISALTGK